MPADPASPSSVARALGLDAATFANATDPPAPPGDLKGDADRFTTLDACVADHAQTDPLVGDALDAIGYDTFLRDACRLLEAMKEKKHDACTAIDSEGLRARCDASVAMSVGAPDDCPWEVAEVRSRGREGRCLAVASRDARLCAGAAHGDRVTCEALVMRDEAKCAGDAKCAREVKRWKNALPSPDGTGGGATGTPLVTRAKLVLHGADGTPDPPAPQIETDLASDLSRGVVLTLDFLGTRFELGTLRELGAAIFAPSPATRPRAALEVLVPPEKPPVVERAEIFVPGGSPLLVPGAKWDGALKVTKLDPKRGGELVLTWQGKLAGGTRAYAVDLQISTFVRDVVRSATAPAPKKR